MNCPIKDDDKADVLLAYCARTLDADTVAILDRHMELCADCARLRDGQRTVWNALEAWEAPPVSADFDQRLFRRIETAAAAPSWFYAGCRAGLDRVIDIFRPIIWRPALPLAAAGMLVVAGFVLDHRPAVSTPDRTSTSTGVSLGASLTISPSVSASEAEQVERTLEDMEMLRQFDQNTQEKDRASKSM